MSKEPKPIDGKDLADTLLGEIFDRGQDSARYEDMLEIGAMTYREMEWMDGFDEGLNYVYRMIENAPTIEAIPIDWILNNKRLPKDGKGLNAILDMIEDWRKENADDSD